MWPFNYETLFDPILRDVRPFVVELSGLTPGARVLDVCCGTGAQVVEYGRAGMSATGIDISPGMLRVAERKKRKSGLENISFQQADATRLPFPDGCFDCVSISLALHDKSRETRNSIIVEMKRVAAKDGVLLFVDYSVPLPGNTWARMARLMERLGGGEHYRGFRDWMGGGGLEELLKSHNLHEERRVFLKSGVLTAVRARKNLTPPPKST